MRMLTPKSLENNPIAYYTHGNKDAQWLLFIHPAFVDHRVYREQFEAFQNSYNILAIDILGHGGSMPRSKQDRFMKMPNWISTILEHEKIDKVHAVGISLGAVVAQLLANQFPHRMRSLACFGAQNVNNFNPKGHGKMVFSNLILGLKGLISVSWFAQASKTLAAISPKGQAAYVEIARQQSKKPFTLFLQASGTLPPPPTTPRSHPLLIGRGDHDALMPASALDAWRNDEPQAQTVTIQDAGHLANLDEPEAFNQALLEFWSATKA